MARFDVYLHPDAGSRKTTPYLLDVQNSHISRIATRVVVPLRSTGFFTLPMRDLNPAFEVTGKQVVLDATALAAVPVGDLKKPVANLSSHGAEIMAALDVLFSSS